MQGKYGLYWSLVVLFWLLLSIQSVSATVLPHRTVNQTIKEADRIVRGVISGKKYLWGPKKHRIYTDYSLRVLEVLKGKAGASLKIRQLGGQMDGLFTQVPGSARYKIGEEVLLLLEKERAPGFLFVQGLAAGKYQILKQNGFRYLHRSVHDLAFQHPGNSPQNAHPTHLNYSEKPFTLKAFRTKIQLLKQPLYNLRSLPMKAHLGNQKLKRLIRLQKQKKCSKQSLPQKALVKSLAKLPFLVKTLQKLPTLGKVKNITSQFGTFRTSKQLKKQQQGALR